MDISAKRKKGDRKHLALPGIPIQHFKTTLPETGLVFTTSAILEAHAVAEL